MAVLMGIIQNMFLGLKEYSICTDMTLWTLTLTHIYETVMYEHEIKDFNPNKYLCNGYEITVVHNQLHCTSI